MKKLLLPVIILLFNISCKQKKSLPDQLKEFLGNHLARLDSSATLDSVHIIRSTAITAKLASIIDDSIFTREYNSIRVQLKNASQKNEKDSVEFYQNETTYMEKEIDSLSRQIARSDTTHHFGFLIGCQIFISRNQISRMDSTFVVIDSKNTVQGADFIDSSLARSIRKFSRKPS